jgi:hypothetical protein
LASLFLRDKSNPPISSARIWLDNPKKQRTNETKKACLEATRQLKERPGEFAGASHTREYTGGSRRLVLNAEQRIGNCHRRYFCRNRRMPL